MNVLIIDSERSVGRRLKSHFRGLGHDCYWAQASDEGLLAAGWMTPDLVVVGGPSCEDHTWQEVVTQLAPRHRCLVYGLRPEVVAGSPGSLATLVAHCDLGDLITRIAGESETDSASPDPAPYGADSEPDIPEPTPEPSPEPIAPAEPEEAEAVYEPQDVQVIEADPEPAEEPDAEPEEDPEEEDELIITTREIELPESEDLEAFAAMMEDPEELEADLTPVAVLETEAEAATFSGELARTPFWEVLYRIHQEGLTGELHLDAPEGAITIGFDSAGAVSASGGGPTSTLGRVMVRAGLLEEDAFRAAISELSETEQSERLGEVLLRQGSVSSVQLEKGLRLQFEEKLMEPFGLAQSSFAFYADRTPEPMREAMPVLWLILRGLTRLPAAELSTILESHLDECPVANTSDLPPALVSSEKVTKLLAPLNGSRTVKALLEKGRKPLAALLILLETAECVHYRVTPMVTASAGSAGPTPPARPDQSELAEAVNELYLRVKGKNHYQVLGLEPEAEPEAIKQACEQLLSQVSSDRLEGLPPDSKTAARAIELRKKFRSIAQTLGQPDSRTAYDASLDEVSLDSSASHRAFQVEELIDQGRKSAEDGRWADAFNAYQTAEQMSEGENADILAGLGVSMYMRHPEGERTVAVRDAYAKLRRALTVRPQFVQAALWAGDLMRLEGRNTDARKLYEHARQIEPSNPRVARAMKALQRPAARQSENIVNIASDVLGEGASTELLDQLKSLHKRAFQQAMNKQLGPILSDLGLDNLENITIRGKQVCSLPLLADEEKLVEVIVKLPAAFKHAIDHHLKKAIASSTEAGVEYRVRVAIIAGPSENPEDTTTTSMHTRAIMAVAKDTATWGTDAGTLETLLGGPQEARQRLSTFGLALNEVKESAGSANPIFVVSPPRKEAAPTQSRVTRPDRPLAQEISIDDIQLLHDLSEAFLANVDEQLEQIFLTLAEAQVQSKESGKLWNRMVKKKPQGPDISKARLRTRLFEPVLQGSKIHLGFDDMKLWLKLLNGVGTQYADALFKEAVAYRNADKSLWDGVKVDRGFADLERLDPPSLYGLSEACRLMGGSIRADQSYEDCSFSELTSGAGQRVRAALSDLGMAPGGDILPRVLEIYDGAIDTPDDVVEPVNFFEYFALVSLIGVTESIRAFEIDHLSETYKPGSSKYDQQLENIHQSFDEYIGILRNGLRQYARINRLFNLRSPFAASEDTRSMFATKHTLPLYHHIEVQA